MPTTPIRFAPNDIASLTLEHPRFDLAESIGPDLTLGALAEGLADVKIGYRTPEGDPELRALVAAKADVDAQDVVITVGAMQALFLIAFILCQRRDHGPQDRIVTTRPLFANARTCMESVGADVAEIPVSFSTGYRLDLDALREALTPETKLVSLATPQNPSGVALSDAEIEAVLCLMGDRCPDAFLLLDDTYREAAYGNEAITPSAILRNPRIVTCASLSKCHGAPGLRIGWMITRDTALRAQLVLGKFNTVITGAAVDEILAIRVLRDQQRILAERRVQLANGLARTEAWVAAHADWVEWVKPDAGALCCVRLRPDVFDASGIEAFHNALAARAPRVGRGDWFGDDPAVFRLGFGLLPMDQFDLALAEMGAALRETGNLS